MRTFVAARRYPPVRPGFTLVEMLVSTALVMMIMLIFAQIYRTATSTMVNQRGIAQNDARARMLSSIIRSDLEQLTFRSHQDPSAAQGLVALDYLDVNEPGFTPVDPQNHSGYFYYSENDIDNDVDDVLQFTMRVRRTPRLNPQEHPFVGRAAPIARPNSASSGSGNFNPQPNGNPDENQPEFDEGGNTRIASDYNYFSQSRFAEVVYFVRDGSLYRRLLLLRDPRSHTPRPGFSAQPQYYETGLPGYADLIPGDYDDVADFDTPNDGFDFWNDFDYSAFHNGSQVRFHGPLSLPNADFDDRISDPKHRFGFKYFLEGDDPVENGKPVEYVQGGTRFIGRLTHQETSDPQFSWPAVFADNPLVATNLTLSTGRFPVVRNPAIHAANQGYRGSRRGEDLLMTNVDAFDVKVFDEGTGSFVDIGHTQANGFFHQNRRANPDYGPRSTGQNNIFDTWHPENITYGRAPYRPLRQAPPAGPPADPAYGNWIPGNTYAVGDVIFPIVRLGVGADNRPGAAGVDDNVPPDGVIDNLTELDPSSGPYGDDTETYYDGIFYRAVVGGIANDATTPLRISRSYGERVNDGEVVWEVVDNRVGVMLIQITVRYRDPASNLSRQLTIQHSFAAGPR